MKKELILLIVLVVVVIWLMRFSIYVTNYPSAYKLDRWTGKITFLVQYEEHQIKQHEDPPSSYIELDK